MAMLLSSFYLSIYDNMYNGVMGRFPDISVRYEKGFDECLVNRFGWGWAYDQKIGTRFLVFCD
jgi:hypothetical protein